MPLHNTITLNSSTKIYIWQIDEDEKWLRDNIELTPACEERVSVMKSEIHRKGFISIRHLLKEAGFSAQELYYDDNGRPHLNGNGNISITHSGTYTGIIISSDNPVGIDIEKQREKILHIAHKFTPISEYRSIANTEALIRKLTMVWCAKESLYKMYATGGLSFLHHIWIEDFAMDDSGTTGEVLFQGSRTHYDIHFMEIDDYTCAYAHQRESPADE